ncbi:MAG: hypothetical protein KDK36_21825 [Leptospiraceae bacterium]|nr:hypothetical protein [Leptospiraceae bacterium]
MTINSILPQITGVIAIIFILSSSFIVKKPGKNSWMIPGLLSVAFLVFSLISVFAEGPFGFWTEHTRNLWGNQIWFDLLLGVSIGWYFILPRARKEKMNIFLWGIIVLSSGCIGFTAMVARLLYLESGKEL